MASEVLDSPFDRPEVTEIDPVTAGTRFANYIIDVILFYVGIILLGVVAGTMGWSFFEWLSENQIVDRLFSMVMYGIFMTIQETAFGGRSIGKFITGTKVVDSEGYKPSTKTLIARNMYRAVPFDQLSFIGHGRGWHDQWSDTYVVKANRI